MFLANTAISVLRHQQTVYNPLLKPSLHECVQKYDAGVAKPFRHFKNQKLKTPTHTQYLLKRDSMVANKQ